jgi:hypothetical protein
MVAPSLQDIEAVSEIMARALQDLHKFIEKRGANQNSRETMVLMMSFITGITIQLRDKMEALQQGLGSQLIEAVSITTQKDSKGLEIIDKLNKNDPSMKKSSSGIEPSDLHSAINFLVNKFIGNIKTNLDALPYALRNEELVLIALAQLIANLLNSIDRDNVSSLIDTFAKNINMLANEPKGSNDTIYN